MSGLLVKPMRAFGIMSILLALTLPAFARGAAGENTSNPPPQGSLQTGRIVSVEKHSEGRPFDWVRGGVAPIPIYDHYPYYDINVQVDSKDYIVRYETQTDYYPAAWKPGSSVQLRLGDGRLYLLRYDGVEVPASIVRESRVRQ